MNIEADNAVTLKTRISIPTPTETEAFCGLGYIIDCRLRTLFDGYAPLCHGFDNAPRKRLIIERVLRAFVPSFSLFFDLDYVSFTPFWIIV